MAPTARGRTATKPPVAAEPELEEDEFEEMDEGDDDADLDELEDEPEEAPKPKTKAKPKAAAAKAAPKVEAPEFGSAWLAAHVTEVTGDTYDGRAVRMLLRKLAKDGKLERVVGDDRTRYSFSGPDDATVKAVVEMVKSGAAKELKQAGLQAVKDQAAAKKAAAKAAKEKAAAEEASEDEEFEEDEDEVEEEAPKPTRRRAPAKTAAPAKATAAARPRRTAAK